MSRYALDNIDVNRFGSRYTIFNGQDGTNITSNNTNYLLDFHMQYNLTVHQRCKRHKITYFLLFLKF